MCAFIYKKIPESLYNSGSLTVRENKQNYLHDLELLRSQKGPSPCCYAFMLTNFEYDFG